MQLHVRGDATIDVSAQVDRFDERGEVVVGEDDLRGLLRHLRTAPHRHADVRLLECRGVVHGIPGHRDHVARLLHQASEPDLVLGGHSSEDVELRESLDDLGIREVRKIGPRDHARS